ncbi:uncharacterized protein LOC109601095 [Aethina tumida]|uniref:uncharacterized protein LOC109601095 n=1 Tax=Aethina tumida TaxID=116153 RepID=UPI00096AFBB5|nr:uncharacterized protein LOC109601095 [Aethina tumida]
MAVKCFIFFLLLVHCWCYELETEIKKYDDLCVKLQKACEDKKLTPEKVEKKLNTCKDAHLKLAKTDKHLILMYMTDKTRDATQAYQLTFGYFEQSIRVDLFHNFIYCMQGLLK